MKIVVWANYCLSKDTPSTWDKSIEEQEPHGQGVELNRERREFIIERESARKRGRDPKSSTKSDVIIVTRKGE